MPAGLCSLVWPLQYVQMSGFQVSHVLFWRDKTCLARTYLGHYEMESVIITVKLYVLNYTCCRSQWLWQEHTAAADHGSGEAHQWAGAVGASQHRACLLCTEPGRRAGPEAECAADHGESSTRCPAERCQGAAWQDDVQRQRYGEEGMGCSQLFGQCLPRQPNSIENELMSLTFYRLVLLSVSVLYGRAWMSKPAI